MKKDEIKSGYLLRIRNQSAYPAFRTVVNVLTFVLYAIAVLLAMSSIFMFSHMGLSSSAGVVAAVIIGIVAKVFQEVSLMIADLTDSILDFNSRNDQKQ